jgi:hypothetical protein
MKEMAMTMVILTADVEDGAIWEREFRTHGDLFKGAGLGTMHYAVAGGQVVICTDVADVGAYKDFLRSKATQDAMKNDGVKRETVQIVVLDKQLSG